MRKISYSELIVLNNDVLKNMDKLVELGADRVEGVLLENLKTGATETVPCRGYFSALGHIPNTGIFKEFIETDAQGYFKTAGATSLTNLAGVFVAGDCADPRYRQAITAAASGCRAAIDAEKYLEENR